MRALAIRNALIAGLFITAIAGLDSNAMAQEIPKQFDFSVSYSAVVSSEVAPLGEEDFAAAFIGNFIATNDAGGAFMHNMFGKCAYAVVRADGVLEMSGGCNYADGDGDQLYETFRLPPGGSGELAFIGGTGKFAGIRCTGKFSTQSRSQDRSMIIGKKTGSCELP